MKKTQLLPWMLTLCMVFILGACHSQGLRSYDGNKGIIGTDPSDAEYYLEYMLEAAQIKQDEKLIIEVSSLTGGENFSGDISVSFVDKANKGSMIDFDYVWGTDTLSRVAMPMSSELLEYYTVDDYDEKLRLLAFDYKTVQKFLDQLPLLIEKTLISQGMPKDTKVVYWGILSDMGKPYIQILLHEEGKEAPCYDIEGNPYTPSEECSL